MTSLNRYKITDESLNDIIQGLLKKPTTPFAERVIQRFPALRTKNKKLFLDGQRVISIEELPKIVNDELVSGEAPLGIDSCYEYLSGKYCGSLTRRKVGAFIKATRTWQLSRTRPPNPNRVRASYATTSEGSTRYLLSKKQGGRNLLSGDLMYVPESWALTKYFLCIVHNRSAYCWFEPLNGRKAKDLVAPFNRVLKDAEKRFGKVSGFMSDQGAEFYGSFHRNLQNKHIMHFDISKAFQCERKIGEFGRTLGQLIGLGLGFSEAVALAQAKLRNVRSRVTGQKAVDIGQQQTLKPGRRLKKGARKHVPAKVFEVGDSVRHLTKNADDTNVMYKSYGTTSRKQKHANWSAKVYKVIGKRKRSGVILYKLANNPKLYKSWELQPITQVITLSVPKQKLEKTTALRAKIDSVKKSLDEARELERKRKRRKKTDLEHPNLVQHRLSSFWGVRKTNL